jgi:hypothetical protein
MMLHAVVLIGLPANFSGTAGVAWAPGVLRQCGLAAALAEERGTS